MRTATIQRRRAGLVAAVSFAATLCALSPASATPILGSDLDTYGVLATTSVTNAGAAVLGQTVIIGNMGANSCTGFASAACTTGPGTVGGTANVGNAAWSSAIAAFGTAYTALTITGGAADLADDTLGQGIYASLAPGVYSFPSTTALLDGALTLAGGSNADPVWVFQIGTGFTADSGSSVTVTDDTEAGLAAAGVYFEIGSTATLGENTTIEGNILAGAEVVFDTGAQITCGRAFAYTTSPGEVTFAGQDPTSLRQNEVSTGCAGTNAGLESSGGLDQAGLGSPTRNVPEPNTFWIFAAGLVVLFAFRRRSAAVSA